eukprot:CAMPEP_0197180700 /NCGR_PEP_ID=MMETSP1423-20130617/5219_1 /TAXON_ID=476441 /ORGANISM="Pseudo-nitzschia heimii, Strain UNC1101" /LENGTH=1221 /DNA_ID=CAMNT_0042630813 /DNA_START=314 /DNA_END=3979 /DNA_ORIENTATION=+
MATANGTDFRSATFSTSTTLDVETDRKARFSSLANTSPTLLQRRLYDRHKIAPSDTCVVGDSDDHNNWDHDDATEEKKDDVNEESIGGEDVTEVIVEIKTLVWEVQAMLKKNIAAETKSTEKFYVVTALQINDKIDTANLKHLIRTSRTTNGDRTLKSIRSMQLAPLEIAENLTGFRSGCMPPICHTNHDMDLYVDESIVEIYNNRHSVNKTPIASIGSGIAGKSLLLPLGGFLRVAGYNLDDSENGAMTPEDPVNKYAGGCYVSPITTQASLTEDAKSVATSDMESGPGKIESDLRQMSKNEMQMMSSQEIRKLKQEDRRMKRETGKDRLKEYRSFNKDDYLSKAKLFRTTVRKKGRISQMEELIQEALVTGDFPKLMEIPEDPKLRVVDKNALHICAWRGDIESVIRLVEVSNEHYPHMDAVNIISKGHGNYGKSSIFYALTQCRDDVVRYLVQEAGADLLIVNNKGQTPCSIAPTHVSEETCQIMFEVEAKQIKTRVSASQTGDEVFANHRASHSDHKLYGDLDPRFPLDDDNRFFSEAARKSEEEKALRRSQNKKCQNGGYDPKAFLSNYMDRTDDLTDQIEEYEESVRLAPDETIVHGFPTQFSPRALRPTVRWWNRDDLFLAKAHDSTLTSGETAITETRSRSRRNYLASLEDEKKEKVQSLHDHNVSRPRFSEVDIDSLDLISIDDVLKSPFNEGKSGTESKKILVNDTHTLRSFEKELDKWILELNQELEGGINDEEAILLKYAWGVDCEWKPGPDCGENSPVSTLQLGTQQNAFLIDLQTICHDQKNIEGFELIEGELDRILLKLFRNSNIILAGYGILQDLGKLAASFPQMKSFAEFVSVVDLHSISSVVYSSKFDRKAMSSLQKMTATLLKKRLDKVQQVSDWSRRPLSEEQISYAMLDAAIVPVLLNAIFDDNPVIKSYNGRFFYAHKNVLSTIRFLPVDPCEDGYAYQIAYGSIKTTLGKAFARQSWPTKMKLDPPEPPKLVEMKPNPNGDSSKPFVTKKERAHLRKLGADADGNIPKRPKPIPLKSLAGNLDNLPIPGISLGYTKESCAFRVVGHKLFETIPDGTYIGFNRRSGVAETSNAWVLFCNFGGDKVFSKFSDNGRKLLFRVNSTSQSGRSSEASLFRQLVTSSLPQTGKESQESKTILLFARESTRTKYLYCGFCTCTDVTTLDEHTAGLVLQLEDYERLMDETLRTSSDFEDLVRSSQR